MKILIATSNPHKLDEIRAIWSSLADPRQVDRPVELMGLSDLDRAIDEPHEDQATFEGNACLKARYYAVATGITCLADDSGLAVHALDGEPGVHSARYAGVQGDRAQVDAANNALLLERLRTTPAEHRAARFVCVMVLCQPPSDERAQPAVLATVRGTIEGCIIPPTQPPRGQHGFGYDPLFYVPQLGKTTAELEPQQKNAISHRGRAARLMWERIQGL